MLTARAQDYMAYYHHTIYDKRGNIVWRLRASPVPSFTLVWHARGERDGGFNWMLERERLACRETGWSVGFEVCSPRGQLLQDDYPVCRGIWYSQRGHWAHAFEWMANDMDICFRTALSCERGTLLRKGIVQLQTKVRAKRASRAIRLVTPKNCPHELLRTVWCFLFGTAPFPESCGPAGRVRESVSLARSARVAARNHARNGKMVCRRCSPVDVASVQ